MNHKEFAQRLKAGDIRGAYLFEGVEENIKDAALAALRKALLPEGMEELNEAVMDNPSTDALIAAAETLPFLADKRLVVVRDHAGLTGRGEGDERLCGYLSRVPDTAVIVFFLRGKADARKKLVTAIKKAGQIVTFARLDEGELNAWIVQAFAALGKACSPQVASLLAFTTGTDTALLRAEIDKLAAHAGDAGAVTEADVRLLATRSIECTVFEMVDAVVAGRQGQAFRLMRDMLTAGQERLGILAMLLRQYRLIQHVKIMQYEKKPPQEIRRNLGVPSFAADRCMAQARGYTGGQVRRAVDICLDTEYRIKAGQLNQEGALEAAMLKIFALRAPEAAG